MNNLKTTPVGTDLAIAKIQKILYDKLTMLWSGNLEAYPRCYIVRREKLTTIEYYLGDKEYGNLVSTEKNKFFFVAESDKTPESKEDFHLFKQDVQLYFILDLKECYPSITHRCDEEVRQDVLNILSKINCEVSKVVVGLKDVFNQVSYKETFDTQPKHCFRIDLILHNIKTYKTC